MNIRYFLTPILLFFSMLHSVHSSEGQNNPAEDIVDKNPIVADSSWVSQPKSDVKTVNGPPNGVKFKPNFLFIFADDLSFNAIHAAGNPDVKTPHIDRLVEQGTYFTNAYNPGSWSAAVCLASRAMVNRMQFLNKAQREIPVEQYWSARMSQAGWETYFTGKWHVSIKPEKVFNHVGTVRGGMPPTGKNAYNRPTTNAPEDDVWSPFDVSLPGHWSGGTHWAEVLAAEAIGFIKSEAQKHKTDSNAKPFFMYVASNSPHDPRQAPRSYVDMYAADKITIPANFLTEHPYKTQIGCPPQLRDERLAPYPRTPHAVQVHRKEYYAIISHLDAQIGRILNELNQSGLRENTYIIFTADNGLAIGSHGLFGKQSVYEHSMKVPLIIVGPKIPAGKRIDTPVYMQDLTATVLDLAFADAINCQFKSLMSLIQDGKNTRRFLFGEYKVGTADQKMIRQGDYKLIYFPTVNKKYLFNVAQDPDEMNDLSRRNPEKVKELLKRMEEYTKSPLYR